MRIYFIFAFFTAIIREMLKKYFLQTVSVLILLGIAWALFLLRHPSPPKNALTESVKTQIQANVSQKEGDTNTNSIGSDFFPMRNWMIDEPEISAKSAIVVDFKTEQPKNNILYQKNAEQKLSIASLTKIMTAIVALENLNPDQVIKISKESVFTDGNNGGLIISEELTVQDLLYIMLVESSNDAAMALANDNQHLHYEEFIKLMNEKATELQMANTHFEDASGLSEKNYSTVSEMIDLVKYAMRTPLLAQILETQETTINSVDNKIIHNLFSTNKLLGKIPVILGGKTGYTDEAGGCMLTFSKIDSSYLVTVVLGSQNREDDTEKLINWAQTAWLWQ